MRPIIPPPVQTPRWILNLLSFLITLSVPIFLLLLSVRLLISPAYLALEYNKPDFPPDYYGFTLADRLHYGPFALNYLVNNADIHYLRDLTFNNGQPFYQENELSHMVDAQHIAQVAFAVLYALTFALVIGSIALSRSGGGRDALRRGLFSGGLLTLLLILGLAVFVLLSWDSFFTQFHELFFAEGTWQFQYSDSLIRLYPVRFWQDTALSIGGLAAAGALLIMAACWAWARRAKVKMA